MTTAIGPYSQINNYVFTPNQVSGLALWLDSTDDSTIIRTGSNVTQWNDKSGNNRNFATTSGTPRYSPANGINFSGARLDIMSTSLTVPYTAGATSLYVVVQVTGVTNGFAYIFVFGNNSSDTSLRYNGAQTFNANDVYFNRTWFLNGSTGGTNIPVSVFNNTTLMNGTINFSGTNVLQISSSFIGRYFSGFIQEVLLFNSTLATEQRQQVESYLAWKWSIQRSLPPTHPYAISPYVAVNQIVNIPQQLINRTTVFPNQLPNLALWLDAADNNTVILSGNNVTQWNDKSGNGWNATAFTGTGIGGATFTNPTYSGNSIVLSGSQFFTTLLSSLIPNQSGFAVISYNFSSASKIDIISLRRTVVGTAGIQQIIVNNQQLITTYGANNIVTGATLPLNQILLYNHTFSAASNAFLYYNGTQTGSTNGPYTFTGNGTINIGAYDNGGEAFRGNIYEVILYSNVLTTQQRQQIEGYLMYKWNIKSGLPVSHPAFTPNFVPSIPTVITPYIWQPNLYSGLALWIDAADASTVGLSGTNVISVRDKTSSAFLFSNATGFTYNITRFNNTYPSFYSPIVSSNLLGSNTSISISQPVTTFMVGSKIGTGISYIFDGVIDANRIAYYQAAGSLFAGSQFGSATPILNTNFIVCAIYNTTNSFGFVNGTQYATGNVGTRNATTGLTLGKRFVLNEGWDGHICEIVFYNRLLSERERQQMEGYLAWKWGLQINLPSSHPFFNFPPG